MKLIGYELHKIWHKRILAILALLLLAVNGAFYYQSQSDEHGMLIRHKERYLQLEQAYHELPPEEGKARATEQEQQLLLYGNFVQEHENPPDSAWQPFIAEMKRNNKEAYSQYMKSSYFNQASLIIQDTYLTQVLKDQFENAIQFRNDMDTMAARAEQMQSVSIFDDKNSFSNRNIVKTVNDFKPLRDLPFELGLEEGIVSGTDCRSTDLCMVILILLLCTILFHLEREDGLLPLICATRNGKLATFGSKLIVLSVLTIGFTVIYYGSILLMAERLFGFGSLSRYIQSMSSFSRAPTPLSVEQYVWIYLLSKAAFNLLFAWLVAAIVLGLRRTSRIYLTLAFLLGGSYLCYAFIHPNSYLNVLKYLNLAAFYDTFRLIADYRNLNVMGYPIRKGILSVFVGGGMLLLLPFLCVRLYMNQGSVARHSGTRWIVNLKAHLFKLRRTNSLVQHEGYKLLIAGKSVLILVLACFYVYHNSIRHEMRFDMDSVYYNRYLAQLEGELDEAKLTFMSDERAKFDELPAQLADLQERLLSQKIDLPSYNLEKFNMEEFAKQEKAFSYVEKQRDYLLQLQERKGIKGSFVNSISSDVLFDRQQADLRDGLIYTLLLLVGLSPMFAMDFKDGMIKVLWSTSKGRRRLFFIKHVLGDLFGVGLLYLIQFPKFYNLIVKYPGLDWHAAVQSVEVLGNVDWPVSILGYVILIVLLQTLGVLMLVHFVLFLAVLVRKQAFMLLTSTIVCILPLCLQYFGLKTIGQFSFNLVFQLDRAFPSHYTMGICIYFGVLLLIGFGASRAAWTVLNSFSGRGK